MAGWLSDAGHREASRLRVRRVSCRSCGSGLNPNAAPYQLYSECLKLSEPQFTIYEMGMKTRPNSEVLLGLNYCYQNHYLLLLLLLIFVLVTTGASDPSTGLAQ